MGLQSRYIGLHPEYIQLQPVTYRVAARARAVGAHAARGGGRVELAGHMELGARQRRRPRWLHHHPELHAGRIARIAVHGRGGLQASGHRRTPPPRAVRPVGAKPHRRAPALGRVPLERRPPGTLRAECEVVARRTPAMSEHGWPCILRTTGQDHDQGQAQAQGRAQGWGVRVRVRGVAAGGMDRQGCGGGSREGVEGG